MAIRSYTPSVATALIPNAFAEYTEPPRQITVLDPDNASRPLELYDDAKYQENYGEEPGRSLGGPVDGPSKPECIVNGTYLFPTLTKNEYARLTMLWYYTRDMLLDKDLLVSLQSKVKLLCQLVGWEIGICGIMESATYRRVAAAGIPLALLSRRESTCSHTVLNNESNHIMAVADMSKDQRFSSSPVVDKGGLRSYAGTPLRCQVDGGEAVALGSVCVASETADKSLTPDQREALLRFAEMMTSEIINRARLRRREQQQRMSEMLAALSYAGDRDELERRVFASLKEVYPNADIRVCNVLSQEIPIIPGLSVPLTEVNHGLWEDSNHIDQLITLENHKELKSDRIVRVIVGSFWSHPILQVLVVASSEVTLVFDDIDAWFVARCSAILGNVIQERTLDEARAVKDHFLRGITHQLRTPLHGVLGSVDILAEELSMKELLQTTAGSVATNGTSAELISTKDSETGRDITTADILRTIRNSGRELMTTINNILRLNKWNDLIQSSLNSDPHDLLSLEESLIEDVRRSLPDIEMDRVCVFFDNQLPLDVNSIMLDTNMIKECLQCLLLNALQYTTAGCVVITTSTLSNESTIAFDVQDTGCCIQKSNRARIFEAYEKEDTHSRGAGLGLTLSSKIAAAMGGSVQLINSQPGAGSLFRLSFPDPRLSFSTSFPASPSLKIASLRIKKFFSIPSAPPSYTGLHFISFLQRQGLEESQSHEGALVSLVYQPEPDSFVASLVKTETIDSLIVCLLPVTEDLEKLRKSYPRVHFFTGPFTSRRLREILLNLDSLDFFSSTDPTPSPLSPPDTEGFSQLSLTTSRRWPRAVIPNTLLVDDNVINLRIIRMYCQKRRLPFVEAVDGLQAIATYKAASISDTPVDLILLDLQMPNCDGIEACRVIRQLEKSKGREASIIFIITGQDSPKDKDKAFAAGADEYYVKPLSIRAIDNAVAKYFVLPNARANAALLSSTTGD